MTRVLTLLAMLTLAACGADGAPSANEPGLTMSGEVEMGVVVNPGMVEDGASQ